MLRAMLGAVFALSGLLMSCGSSSDSDGGGSGDGDGSPSGDGDGDSGGDGDGDGDAVICYEGGTCRCDGGPEGTTICVEGEPTCVCDGCPDYTRQRPAELSFDACGGDPTGTWVSIEADWSTWVPDLAGSSVPVEIAPDDLRYRLQENGDAEFFRGGPIYTIYIPRDDCSTIVGNGGRASCTTEACGLCECELENPDSSETGTWTASETELVISATLFRYSAEFCVEGDTMYVNDSDRLVTFKRVETAGFPADDPNDECGLGDYGVVPGCVFVENAVCQGVPKPCAEYTSDTECAAQSGCSVGEACGGSNYDCSGFTQEECSYVSSCFWSGVCTGTGVCSEEELNCEWLSGLSDCFPSNCAGEATHCETLTVDACGTVEGCRLGEALTAVGGGALGEGTTDGDCDNPSDANRLLPTAQAVITEPTMYGCVEDCPADEDIGACLFACQPAELSTQCGGCVVLAANCLAEVRDNCLENYSDCSGQQ